MTDLVKLGDEIYSLQMQEGIATGELMTLEQELNESDVMKQIRKKKKEILELQTDQTNQKEYLEGFLLNAGVKSIETEKQKFTLKKSGGSVKVINEDEIPANYFNEVVTKKLDKKALKEGLNLGDVVPGAKIEYKYSLLVTPK